MNAIKEERIADIEAWNSEDYKAWADQEAYECYLQNLADAWREEERELR